MDNDTSIRKKSSGLTEIAHKTPEPTETAKQTRSGQNNIHFVNKELLKNNSGIFSRIIKWIRFFLCCGWIEKNKSAKKENSNFSFSTDDPEKLHMTELKANEQITSECIEGSVDNRGNQNDRNDATTFLELSQLVEPTEIAEELNKPSISEGIEDRNKLNMGSDASIAGILNQTSSGNSDTCEEGNSVNQDKEVEKITLFRMENVLLDQDASIVGRRKEDQSSIIGKTEGNKQLTCEGIENLVDSSGNQNDHNEAAISLESSQLVEPTEIAEKLNKPSISEDPKERNKSPTSEDPEERNEPNMGLDASSTGILNQTLSENSDTCEDGNREVQGQELEKMGENVLFNEDTSISVRPKILTNYNQKHELGAQKSINPQEVSPTDELSPKTPIQTAESFFTELKENTRNIVNHYSDLQWLSKNQPKKKITPQNFLLFANQNTDFFSFLKEEISNALNSWVAKTEQEYKNNHDQCLSAANKKKSSKILFYSSEEGIKADKLARENAIKWLMESFDILVLNSKSCLETLELGYRKMLLKEIEARKEESCTHGNNQLFEKNQYKNYYVQILGKIEAIGQFSCLLGAFFDQFQGINTCFNDFKNLADLSAIAIRSLVVKSRGESKNKLLKIGGFFISTFSPNPEITREKIMRQANPSRYEAINSILISIKMKTESEEKTKTNQTETGLCIKPEKRSCD